MDFGKKSVTSGKLSNTGKNPLIRGGSFNQKRDFSNIREKRRKTITDAQPAVPVRSTRRRVTNPGKKPPNP